VKYEDAAFWAKARSVPYRHLFPLSSPTGSTFAVLVLSALKSIARSQTGSVGDLAGVEAAQKLNLTIPLDTTWPVCKATLTVSPRFGRMSPRPILTDFLYYFLLQAASCSFYKMAGQ
jgi:hypothetical protein